MAIRWTGCLPYQQALDAIAHLIGLQIQIPNDETDYLDE